MAKRRRSPVEDIEIAYAARPRKPGLVEGDAIRAQHLLHMPAGVRMVPLPEPVDVPRTVNGRPLKSWERGLYVEAVHRERRAELVLFRGLIG